MKRDGPRIRPQDIPPATYSHLWHAANITIPTPAISRFLARTLDSVVPEDGMSAFAQRMHCRTCSALMNNASVRIRKINKRRRGKGERSRNVVVRKCHDCGAHNAENGSITRCRPTADRSEVQELVNDAKRRIRRGDKDRTRNIDPQIGEDLKNGNNLGVEKGRVKKKKKRKGKRLRDGKSDGSSSAPPSGLAASFLFEPIN